MYLWREQSGDMANKSEFIKILSGKNFTANILMQLEKDAGTIIRIWYITPILILDEYS